jgi:hypothetical protein
MSPDVMKGEGKPDIAQTNRSLLDEMAVDSFILRYDMWTTCG